MSKVKARLINLYTTRLSNMWLPALFAVAVGIGTEEADAQARFNASTIKAGHDVAVATCLTCHQFSSYSDAALPRLLVSGIPSFEEIAKKPNVTADSLCASMNSASWHDDSLPLPFRPLSQVSDPERDEVAAFIESFRYIGRGSEAAA